MKNKSAFALTLLLSVAGNSWSQDVVAKKPVANAPAVPVFSLHDRNVQKIVAAAAQKQSASMPEETSASEAAPATGLIEVKFKAPRRVHHMHCDSFNCIAYNADDVALYTIPREQYFGVPGDKPADAWLACQSGDDLLTTFERYDKCRGITIGLPPLAFGNVLLDTPKLTF
jgi:hypothetical protein